MITPRILVLGNDASGLEFISCMVRHTMVDGKVNTTTSPREALERIRCDEYHTVLTDIDLPGTSGLDFLRDTFSLWPRPTIVPIVSDHTKLPPGYEAAAFTYLEKPICFHTLSTVLQHAVEFNILQRRSERLRQVLGLIHEENNAFGEQLRTRITDDEVRMKALLEQERPPVPAGSVAASDYDDPTLQDPSFGWALESLVIHAQDMSRRPRKNSKVA